MRYPEENSQRERLVFLCRIVRKEIVHLETTFTRLFPGGQALRPDQVQALLLAPELSEMLDAFVARFSRLQDTVGDKLLPALLLLSGESIGPSLDCLNKAEKFGWMESVDEWVGYRALRNQMIHEYIEDVHVLANALNGGRSFVPRLVHTSSRIVHETEQRLNSLPCGVADNSAVPWFVEMAGR
jgi:hypothetical protein